ncbi:hypothetical protein [Rhodococcus sp. H29-C3]
MAADIETTLAAEQRTYRADVDTVLAANRYAALILDPPILTASAGK